ncbi:hypothetical protein RhiJN_23026 [Ceratobasidium sp. AG-Ba]|nr:hypothetical protein RhiJN_23026 [Ceratobasidium sp. AG-Ba]
MAYTRAVFVVPIDEMASVGLEYQLYPYPEQTVMVAYTAAQLIMEGLPPIGYVRVYDAVIDGKACYADFIGARNTPLDRISSITVQQFYNLFERNPEEYSISPLLAPLPLLAPPNMKFRASTLIFLTFSKFL